MTGIPRSFLRAAVALAAAALLAACGPGTATHPSEAERPTLSEGWPSMPVSDRHARRWLSGVIHDAPYRTALCGCAFTPGPDGQATGSLAEPPDCGFEPADEWPDSAKLVEWTPVVPDSQLPTGEYDCWTVDGGGRGWCLQQDPDARAMLLDLHNRLPVVAQIARYRGDKPLAEIAGEAGREFGTCAVQVTDAGFEPPDCRKGDIARIRLYMVDAYDAELPDAAEEMLERWSGADPVSPRELERAKRIATVTGRRNDYVQDVDAADPAGACSPAAYAGGGSGDEAGADGEASEGAAPEEEASEGELVEEEGVEETAVEEEEPGEEEPGEEDVEEE